MIVTRTYGLWRTFTNELAGTREGQLLIENTADRLATALERDLKAKLLIPIGDPTVHFGAGLSDDFTRNRRTLVVERRANGLPPEERLPQGWRAIFMAP